MLILSATEVKHSVWSIVINPKGKVLVAKRSKKSNNPNLWNFPGGGVENGETPIQCAYRELAEEMGVQRSDVSSEGRYTIKTRDRQMTVYVFLCNTQVKPKPRKAEVQAAKWLTIDEIERESRSPKKWHFPTFMILHHPATFEAMKVAALKAINPTK